MKKLNIVYANMRAPRYEIALPEHDALAVWTVTEEPDADVVIYHSGYSVDRRRAGVNPAAFCVLCARATPLVLIEGQIKEVWKKRHLINRRLSLTLNRILAAFSEGSWMVAK